jgi:integrative and conjugative element protein (TIGR02256 family)
MPEHPVTNPPLRFRLPNGIGLLEFSPQVLAHLEAHKQRKLFAREAGGQLFASFDDPSVMQILDITGPRQTDKRSIYNYEPDRIAEKAEISERFARGVHFVGDWHTHRQRIPTPSGIDEHSIRELVRLSSHDLVGFVLVVVGQAAFPEGLHVSFHSKTASTLLVPLMSHE